MSCTLLRASLLAGLRAAPARSGLRRAAQAWWGAASGVRPFAACRPVAAAAVEAAPEAASSSAPQQQPPEAPAFRAFVDFKFVRDNVEAVAANCQARLSTADPHLVASLYEQYVAAQQETDKLRAARNENSSAMKVGGPPPPLPAACSCAAPSCWRAPLRSIRSPRAASAQGKLEPEQRAALIEKGKAIKEQLEGVEARLVQLEDELQREGQRLPNMTHPGARCGRRSDQQHCTPSRSPEATPAAVTVLAWGCRRAAGAAQR